VAPLYFVIGAVICKRRFHVVAGNNGAAAAPQTDAFSARNRRMGAFKFVAAIEELGFVEFRYDNLYCLFFSVARLYVVSSEISIFCECTSFISSLQT